MKQQKNEKEEEENGKEIINKINRGLISLLSFQFISKIFTFFMNTFIITRNINAETKGVKKKNYIKFLISNFLF